MKIHLVLFATAILLGGCHKKTNSRDADPAKEGNPGPCAVKPTDEDFYGVTGQFQDDAGDVMLTEVEWPKQGPSENLVVRVPTLMAKYFPSVSPYTAVTLALTRGECGRVEIGKGAAIQLASGAQVRFDVRPLLVPPLIELNFVVIENAIEKVIHTAHLRKVEDEKRIKGFDQWVKPVVVAYLALKKDSPKNVLNTDYLNDLAKSGRVTALSEWLNGGVRPLRQEEIDSAAEEAVRESQFEVVKLLLPKVSRDTFNKLHCRLNPGFSVTMIGDVHDVKRAVPANLQNVDILNLLLSLGSGFGSCANGDHRDQILAGIADVNTLEYLERIPGIGEEKAQWGRNIFWLLFQNPKLCLTDYPIGRFLGEVGYLSAMRAEDRAGGISLSERFHEKLLLKSAAKFCSQRSYISLVASVNADFETRKKVQEELARSIESTDGVIAREKDLAIRLILLEGRDRAATNLGNVF